MDQQTMFLAGGVTTVVGLAVTGMWALENLSFGSAAKDTGTKKRERGRKASEMKAKKDKGQDTPAQRKAPAPAPVPAPAPAPASAPPAPAPAPPAPAPKPLTATAPAPAPSKEGGKKKSKKAAAREVEAEEAEGLPLPGARPGATTANTKQAATKSKRGAGLAEPVAKAAAGEAKANKKKQKAAALQADADDGWCQVGKGGKPKDVPVAVKSAAVSEGDASEAFFQVPVGAGGDFLQSSSVATSGSGALASVAGSGPAAVATVGQRKKDKKKKGGDADESPSNGWSPATDEVASGIARDLATMTIAPSPVKKVVAEDEEWATVPIKSKKKSSKA